jgi:ABC-type multidrug transport system fused ATPase/permease subunit
MQGKTCLWVSHRLSSIQTADQIIVLEDGEIRERGTHDQLMEIDDIYAGMYEKQRLEESLSLVE